MPPKRNNKISWGKYSKSQNEIRYKRTMDIQFNLQISLCGNAKCDNSWCTTKHSLCLGLQFKRVGYNGTSAKQYPKLINKYEIKWKPYIEARIILFSWHLRIKPFPWLGNVAAHNIKEILRPALITQTYIVCSSANETLQVITNLVTNSVTHKCICLKHQHKIIWCIEKLKLAQWNCGTLEN